MTDGLLDAVEREIQEIGATVSSILEEDDGAPWGDDLDTWAQIDGDRVREAAALFEESSTAPRAAAAVAAVHAFDARLDSIHAAASAQAAGAGGTGGVLSKWWSTLKAKTKSLLQQVWSLIASKANVQEWTLTGELGVSVLGLGKASIAIKFA